MRGGLGFGAGVEASSVRYPGQLGIQGLRRF